MINHDRTAIQVFETDGVIGKLLIKSEYCEAIKLEIQPNKTLARHLVDFAATFFVISGEGIYLSSSQESVIFAGTIIVEHANTERGFTNTGKNALEILVIKHLTS